MKRLDWINGLLSRCTNQFRGFEMAKTLLLIILMFCLVPIGGCVLRVRTMDEYYPQGYWYRGEYYYYRQDNYSGYYYQKYPPPVIIRHYERTWHCDDD